MMATQNRFRGCLLGLACGDAMGTTVEFKARGNFEPVTDMVGGGPFKLKPGQWTDDTSLALCLATSLIEKDGFDPKDQMERYCRWHREGYLSSTGECFDIGNTTASALHKFEATGEPYAGATDSWAAGNGSIMRLAPVPMFFFPDREQVIHYSGESSRTTHGSEECVDACRLFGETLFLALSGAPRDEILFAPKSVQDLSPKVQEITDGTYRDKEESDIEGSGYVIRSLEAALWCFLHTETFRDAILRAVNLGDDADTTAAVCGQIAGAFYGEDGIPKEWLSRLTMAVDIRKLADRLQRS